jgi:hypothetical protein
MSNFRPIAAGMGQAVAERTILRRKANGELEDWGDVADRVSLGNAMLMPATDCSKFLVEWDLLRHHIANGNTLMSGRHLQHGDVFQPGRNLEVFSNCSTSATSFLLFYLLLNGSGVGRCYDDDMMLVDWNNAPSLRCVLDTAHPDFDYAAHESKRDALHKYGSGKDVMWHEVDDSREGWTKAVEIWENAAFERIHAHKMLILDFSKVRARGSPIGGMQNRPASGPVPLMCALDKVATLKGSGIARWLQAMYVDHYLAECVLVGGARRAARMSTKHWSDPTIFDFITVKRPIEYVGKTVEEITALRKASAPMSFLWSSNNSIMVDEEFWDLVKSTFKVQDARTQHAKKVFNLVCEAAYADGTGEPGFINCDKLIQKDDGWTDLNRGDYIGGTKYFVEDDTQILLSKLAKRAKKKKHHMIVNPCVTGDTVIATVDGPKTFAELAEEGDDVLVYAWHPKTKLPVVRMMRCPHKTRFNVPVIEVEFDSGLKVRMTPDHSLFTFRGKKIKAKDLKVGKSVRAFSMSKHRDGHLRAHAWDDVTNSAKHQWVHRMIWENENGPIPEGMCVHHIDEDKENNVTSNMELVTDVEHNKIHYAARFANGFDGTCANHKVVAIRDAGTADVYNGCVDDAHTYIIVDPEPVAGILSGIVSANCGEIALSLLGGFCVIADVVPFHAESLSEAEECFRVVTRALMRVNLMRSVYDKEVARTNRIGVGMTGVHEFAWKFFGLGFHDLIHEEKSQAFWNTLARFSRAVRDEAHSYAKELGVKVPHTMTTIKPAGTTSKLFLLTEGWHLPSMREFVRWVQFRSDDPLVQTYKDAGYPTRELVTYGGTTIVGFPTAPTITTLGMGDKLVTASEATPEEQFTWLRLGEKYWINGGLEADTYGNQISYTLKYLPSKISLEDFKIMMATNQSTVRCCSVLPQEENSSYEYLPEQMVTQYQYMEIMKRIKGTGVSEDIGKEHVDCAGGACPVDFQEGAKA